MEVIRFDGVSRWYGAREIFGEASAVLRDGDKVGIVGPNGAGKSTLLRILVGIDEPDSGTIVRDRDRKIGYLVQAASESDAHLTLRTALERAFAGVHDDEAALRALEAQITDAAERDDHALQEKLLHRYGEARESFDRHGGEDLEAQMRSIVATFGFTEEDLDRPLASFSGGQRTKAMLARVLLERPDVLALDEPTNHLDIETVRWLEDFIIADPRATILVSHDRYVLERACTSIWEVDRETLTVYETSPGRAYTSFLAQREAMRERMQRDFDAAQAELKREKAVIAELRTHGSHNYVQVKSREKRLAAKPAIEAPPEIERRAIGVALAATRRATTGIALEAKGLAKAYVQPLFSNVSLQIARGENVAIVGPNGAGKSTLLDILAERRAPDAGSVKYGVGLRTAYFSQNAADELPTGVRAVDAVMNAGSATEEEARGLLGRMRLTGDAGDKPVEAFSGGERRRIMLARLMAQHADFLFLDEPTNDLDIASRESLEDVLAEYEGALAIVSHDRYLLKRLAQRVVWLRGDGKVDVIVDGYDAFEARAAAVARGEHVESTLPPVTRSAAKKEAKENKAVVKTSRDEVKRLKRAVSDAERRVADLDDERVSIEAEFAAGAVYADKQGVVKLQKRLESLKRESDAAIAAWEGALAAYEAVES